MSTDKIADGKPAGRKIRVWDSNKAIDGATWIADHSGYRGEIERFYAAANQKTDVPAK